MTDEARKEEIRLCGLPGMQAFFREKMGESRERDYFHCLTCGANFTKHQDDCNCNDYDAERWIICPLAIDSDNPERGLWGMISNCSAKLHFEPCRLDSCKWSFTWHSLEDGPFCKYGETPTLALLHAIAAQIGQEV